MAAFEFVYKDLYGQTIPGQDIEVISWTLSLAAQVMASTTSKSSDMVQGAPAPVHSQIVFDPQLGKPVEVQVYDRMSLKPGHVVHGPALITEDQTTTVVTSLFSASIDATNSIVLEQRAGAT